MMQIAPFFDHERKNIFDWDPFDYLHWLRNIQDCEEFMGNERTMKFVKMIADGLFSKIETDQKKKK